MCGMDAQARVAPSNDGWDGRSESAVGVAHQQKAREDRIGVALRRARTDAGLSVREMARSLGCSPSHISQIERGLTSPSVNTLYNIVRRLGMSFDDLFADRERGGAGVGSAPASAASGDGSAESRIVRADRRHGIVLTGGVRWELLTPSVEPAFEFVEYIYEVGGSDGDDYLRYEGREHGVVLEGRLAGAVGFEAFELGPGDSITFDSSIPHRFWNVGDVPARAIWIDRRERADEQRSQARASHGPVS